MDYYFGGFKSMWLMCMFDLPVELETEKRDYTRFKKSLFRNGFTMLQYSVYVRFCPSYDHLVSTQKRVERSLPFHGEIRLLPFTDHQFQKMQTFIQRTKIKTESAPLELTLF